jgi:hypothetical protein
MNDNGHKNFPPEFFSRIGYQHANARKTPVFLGDAPK